METEQKPPKTGWLVAFSLIISLILFPPVFERIIWDTSLIEKVFNRYIMRDLQIFAFVFAQPLGWLNTIIGSRILSRRPGKFNKVVAIFGFVLGILGILTGLIWNVIALLPY